MEPIHNCIVFKIVRFLGLPILLTLTIIIFLWLMNLGLISGSLTFWILIPLLIIELMLWIAFVFGELQTQYKISLLLKRNTKVLTIASCIFAGCLIYSHVAKGDYEFTEYSPCGKYKLEVYSHPHIFAMPGGGGHYSRSVTIILKNKWGLTIGRSDNEAIYAGLEIVWDYPNNCVWFERGNCIYF